MPALSIVGGDEEVPSYTYLSLKTSEYVDTLVASVSKFSPLNGTVLSPADLIRILLFLTTVLILGLALSNSKVALSFRVGNGS